MTILIQTANSVLGKPHMRDSKDVRSSSYTEAIITRRTAQKGPVDPTLVRSEAVAQQKEKVQKPPPAMLTEGYLGFKFWRYLQYVYITCAPLPSLLALRPCSRTAAFYLKGTAALGNQRDIFACTFKCCSF